MMNKQCVACDQPFQPCHTIACRQLDQPPHHHGNGLKRAAKEHDTMRCGGIVIPAFWNQHALLDAFDMKPGFQYYYEPLIFNSAKEIL